MAKIKFGDQKGLLTILALCAIVLTGVFVYTALFQEPEVTPSPSDTEDYFMSGLAGKATLYSEWSATALGSTTFYVYETSGAPDLYDLRDSAKGSFQIVTSDADDGEIHFVNLYAKQYGFFIDESLTIGSGRFARVGTFTMPPLAKTSTKDPSEERSLTPNVFYAMKIGTPNWGDSTPTAAQTESAGKKYIMVLKNSTDKSALCAPGYELRIKVTMTNDAETTGSTELDQDDLTFYDMLGNEINLKHDETFGYYLSICDFTGVTDYDNFTDAQWKQAIGYDSNDDNVTGYFNFWVEVADAGSSAYSDGATGNQVAITFTPVILSLDEDGDDQTVLTASSQTRVLTVNSASDS